MEAVLPAPFKHVEADEFHDDILNCCFDQAGFLVLTEKEISKHRSQEQMQGIGFYALTSMSNVLQKIMTYNSITLVLPSQDFQRLQLQELKAGLVQL